MSPRRRPAIIFVPGNVGLGNRLRALVGYLALCRCVDARCSVVWTREVACDTGYRELFEAFSDVELLHPRRLAERVREPRTAVALMSPWANQIWRIHGAGLVPLARYRAAVRRVLRELAPRKRIREEADRFAREHGLAGCRGFHIRTTDLVEAVRYVAGKSGVNGTPKLSRLKGFLCEMERHPKERFFVATDDSSVEEKLKRRFGERAIFYPKTYRLSLAGWREAVRGSPLIFGHRTTDVRDALVEMLLLGRCRSVVGTHRSSFSKFAAVWGGAPYQEIQGERCVRLRLPLEAVHDR